MKKILFTVLILYLLIFSVFSSSAAEYPYIPNNSATAEDEIEDLINALPDNYKNKIIIPGQDNIGSISKAYDIDFFIELLKENTQLYLPNLLNKLSVLIGMIIIVSLIRRSFDNIGSGSLDAAVSMCTGLAVSLSVLSVHKEAILSVSAFLNILSDTMLLIVPIMETIYISSGNITLASVTTTGLNVMIAFTENVFSKVLSPAISVCFILSAVSSATNNKATAFIVKLIRDITTGALVLIMSLITMVFTLQVTAASSADKFTSKAIRFALGNYIPIVGGAVSESFSLFTTGISTIKDAVGITAIVIILILCFGPVIHLIMHKFSTYIASNVSGMLDCSSEEHLFSEIGSCYNLLLAVVISAVVMYIIALSQFCRSAGALF